MSILEGKEVLFDDPLNTWKPYQPTPDEPWDAARVAHLHRRAGLGANWGQVERDVKEGYEPSLRRVLDGETHGPSGQPAADFADTVGAMEESAQRRPSIERIQMLWLYRLIYTPFPLAEVMTLAWHCHYATSQAKVNSAELMLVQHNAQRALWRAPISQLHRQMLGDGAMRRWLDGLNSTKAQPNENLGREFLELFSLGEGQFTERDVRGAARALTGWREVDSQERRDEFDSGDFDDGAKTILGQTGNWGLDDLVEIACHQQVAATHIARRLYHTFISNTDLPSAGLLAPLAYAMRTPDDVDVARGIEVVLRSRLFHARECRGRFVKSPVGLAIGAIRSLELFAPPPDLVDLEIHLTKMGQRLFFPPSVAGWPRGLDWLGGQELVARANFAAWIDELSRQGNESHLSDLARRYGQKSTENQLDALATLLLGEPAPVAESPPSKRTAGALFGTVGGLLSLPEAQLG